MVHTSLRESNRPARFEPFLSICVPQYNRTDFLIKSLQTFASQDFRDFEVCISDDCSDDGREDELLNYLRKSGLTFVYARTTKNLRYDGNVRRSIALSAGNYILLMGNDDGLSDTNVLKVIHDDLLRFQPVAVAITNFRELPSGRIHRRMTTAGVIGAGPRIAVSTFRNYSFVSGVILKGDAARAEATGAYDGTEMYQMYLGTRLIAAGGRFLAIDRICVDKDLQIIGQATESYRSKPRIRPCPLIERPLPMARLLEVVVAGLEPYHSGAGREENIVRVAAQLYRFTYPFWAVEYRRVQSWRYALGVFLAFRPSRLAKGLTLSRSARMQLWLRYLGSGIIALTVPVRIFDALRPRLYAIAKRMR